MTFVPSGYSENISIGGSRRISTLSGDIRLEQNKGRLAVYDTGTSQERTIVDIRGLTTIRSDGTYAGRYGQASNDNRDGAWVAAPNIDLRDLGIG